MVLNGPVGHVAPRGAYRPYGECFAVRSTHEAQHQRKTSTKPRRDRRRPAAPGHDECTHGLAVAGAPRSGQWQNFHSRGHEQTRDGAGAQWPVHGGRAHGPTAGPPPSVGVTSTMIGAAAAAGGLAIGAALVYMHSAASRNDKRMHPILIEPNSSLNNALNNDPKVVQVR